MPTFENLDFLNANSLRSFPIKEGLAKLDVTGVFEIPDDFLVDLIVSASSEVSLRVYISKIVNLPEEISVELSAYGSSIIIGTFNIPVLSFEGYSTYTMTAASGYVNASGKLTVGVISSMAAMPYGSFSFNAANTEVEARTVIPGLATISRFVFVNSDGTTFSASGEITLLAETNMVFRRINSTTVALDAGDGLGLNADCLDTRPCLKSINNISPDVNGNFWITTSDCAKITPLADGDLKGLNISDTCCKPCLSCNEIGDLTTRLMQLETDMLAVKNHYNEVATLAQQVTTLASASCECN